MKETTIEIESLLLKEINSFRSNNNQSNYYKYHLPEGAIDEYWFNSNNINLFHSKLSELKFNSKYYKDIQLETSIQKKEVVKKNYVKPISSLLFSLLSSDQTSPIFSNNECFTHISIKVNINEHELKCLLFVFLSQMTVGIDRIFKGKTSLHIIGSILIPQCEIISLMIYKNSTDSINIQANNGLLCNKENSSFLANLDLNIHKDCLGVRKIFCNIKYEGCGDESDVGLCEIINFKSLDIKEFKTYSIENIQSLYINNNLNSMFEGSNTNTSTNENKVSSNINLPANNSNSSFPIRKPNMTSLAALRNNYKVNNKSLHVIPEEDTLVNSNSEENSLKNPSKQHLQTNSQSITTFNISNQNKNEYIPNNTSHSNSQLNQVNNNTIRNISSPSINTNKIQPSTFSSLQKNLIHHFQTNSKTNSSITNQQTGNNPTNNHQNYNYLNNQTNDIPLPNVNSNLKQNMNPSYSYNNNHNLIPNQNQHFSNNYMNISNEASFLNVLNTVTPDNQKMISLTQPQINLNQQNNLSNQTNPHTISNNTPTFQTQVSYPQGNQINQINQNQGQLVLHTNQLNPNIQHMNTITLPNQNPGFININSSNSNNRSINNPYNYQSNIPSISNNIYPTSLNTLNHISNMSYNNLHLNSKSIVQSNKIGNENIPFLNNILYPNNQQNVCFSKVNIPSQKTFSDYINKTNTEREGKIPLKSNKNPNEYNKSLEDKLIGYNKRTYKFFNTNPVYNIPVDKTDPIKKDIPSSPEIRKYTKMNKYIQNTDEKALKEVGVLTNSNIKFMKVMKGILYENSDNEEKYNLSNPYTQFNDKNIYHNIDKYIFNDYYDDNQSDPNEEIDKIDNEKRRINMKVIDFVINKYLTKEEIDTYNSSYEDLFYNKSCCDVILIVGNEEIHSHKIILISKSVFLKELIIKNENELKSNKGFTTIGYNYQQSTMKIVLNEKINVEILNLVLQYMYLNIISTEVIPKSNQSKKRQALIFKDKPLFQIEDLKKLREMLLLADYLMINSLQKVIIVKYIVPNITKEYSIKLLKDAYKRKTTADTVDVWKLLMNFSLNSVAKNSSFLIKSYRNELLSMNPDLLIKVVEQSAFYLIEESHLSNLIKLITDIGYASDIFELNIKLSKPYMNCRLFDSQDIDISPILKSISSINPIELSLIEDHKYRENNNKNQESKENKGNCMDNINKSKRMSPTENLSPNIDLKSNNDPTFSLAFSIDDEKTESCTIISQVFNSNSRSWSLKIDISQEGEVSLFLIERGEVYIIDKKLEVKTGFRDRFSIKFSSILFEFEVKDVSFCRNGVIFYSFPHDHHHIIGHSNFFNLKQLSRKDRCLINVWIKEFPLHSACLQHISENFYQLLSLYESSIPNGTQIKGQQVKPGRSVFDLNLFDIVNILSNDLLNVPSEDDVMMFIFKYSSLKSYNSFGTNTNIDYLIDCVRFKYVSFNLLCISVRDSFLIKDSEAFKRKFSETVRNRIEKPCENNQIPIQGQESTTAHFIEDTYKTINLSKRSDLKRNFYSESNKAKSSVDISNEIINFFINNEHHKSFQSEIVRLQKELDKEKEEIAKKEKQYNQMRLQMQMEINEIREKEERKKRFFTGEVDEKRRSIQKDYDEFVRDNKSDWGCCII